MIKKNDKAKVKKVAMQDLTPQKAVKGGSGSKPGVINTSDI